MPQSLCAQRCTPRVTHVHPSSHHDCRADSQPSSRSTPPSDVATNPARASISAVWASRTSRTSVGRSVRAAATRSASSSVAQSATCKASGPGPSIHGRFVGMSRPRPQASPAHTGSLMASEVRGERAGVMASACPRRTRSLSYTSDRSSGHTSGRLAPCHNTGTRAHCSSASPLVPARRSRGSWPSLHQRGLVFTSSRLI